MEGTPSYIQFPEDQLSENLDIEDQEPFLQKQKDSSNSSNPIRLSDIYIQPLTPLPASILKKVQNKTLFPFSFSHKICLLYQDDPIWRLVSRILGTFWLFFTTIFGGIVLSVGFNGDTSAVFRIDFTALLLSSNYWFAIWHSDYFVELSPEFSSSLNYERWSWLLVFFIGFYLSLFDILFSLAILKEHIFYLVFFCVISVVTVFWNILINTTLYASFLWVHNRNAQLVSNFQKKISFNHLKNSPFEDEWRKLPSQLLDILHRIELTSTKFQYFNGIFTTILIISVFLGIPPNFSVGSETVSTDTAKYNFIGNILFIYGFILLSLIPPIRVNRYLNILKVEIQSSYLELSTSENEKFLEISDQLSDCLQLLSVENFKPSVFGFTLTPSLIVQVTSLYFSFIFFIYKENFGDQ